MRRSLPLFFASSVVALTACVDTTDPVAPPPAEIETARVGVGTEAGSFLLVARSSGGLPDGFSADVRAAGGEVRALLGDIGVAVVEARDAAFLRRAEKIGGIQAVVPNVSVRMHPDGTARPLSSVGDPPMSGEDDPFFDLQWGHDAADVTDAWNATGLTGAGVRVAILDDGVDAGHVDLAANINSSLSTSFVPNESFDSPPGTHGTAMASILGAPDNGLGMIGVAPGAEIVAVKVLDAAEPAEGTLGGLLQGILYGASIDADVISMSLGLYLTRRGGVSPPDTPLDPSDDVQIGAQNVAAVVTIFQRVSIFARQQGSLLLGSAGNEAADRNGSRDLVHLPSDLPAVLSIAASAPKGWGMNPTMPDDELNGPTSYSNSGRSKMDLAAPGGDFWTSEPWAFDACTIQGFTNVCFAFDGVLALFPANGIGWVIGTSPSAPFTAGVAALVIEEAGGDLDPARVEAALKRSAENPGGPGTSTTFAHGVVNARRALQR